MRPILFAALALLACGCCCKPPGGSTSSGSSVDGASTGAPVGQVAPTAKAAEPTITVDIKTLLADYKGNEVRADGKYKDKRVRITGGKVGDIKKDMLDKIYVSLGTGAIIEFPMVQCFPDDALKTKASNLNKGDSLTVTGHVQGLMMNVLVDDCRF